ncbi:SPFH domain-containing protein [Fervidibacter sacchari]|uniref:Regulator of protease activity HflC (Stomatin/prohibitin superfamily) n=1 Tax=Candidatus Fervidibacter sacchari TaxID=1448929 RepID=A0ABT2ENV7_9BACT|nr:SPFH domain-containing protein [Candidatus Fervidibacter sacchari]MCS3918583.1 regulator of protease activity HflC (stomatin/prohibitin superfamily) [Candidatus Fervidibacter sacchari]WKU17653.1 SPFH domain-containing protein [Candidatus Fervidibacter sacchari]
MSRATAVSEVGVQFAVWLLLTLLLLIFGFLLYSLGMTGFIGWGIYGLILVAVPLLVAASIRIAAEWERIAVLRLGKFVGMRGPGLFFIIPILETTPARVDLRVRTYDVPRQRSLSKDNVPVTVDAVVYFRVRKPDWAVLRVQDYDRATQLGAQSILRDMIGKFTLDQLLGERERLAQEIRKALDGMTNEWGIEVPMVEVREVIVDPQLEVAIAREAAAEREKRARVRLAEAEKLAAQLMLEAAQTYARDPIALQLRSMNMLYEMTLEGKSTVIFVPTETHLAMPMPVGVYGLIEKLSQLTKPEEPKTASSQS